MITKEQITEIVNEYIQETDFFLVDVNVRPGNIIVTEIDSNKGVAIDDCVKLSKHIESQLNRDTEDFELEVGSAGVTSPFKIPKQYEKNIGNEVEVLTKSGKKISGILKTNNNDSFTIIITKLVKPEGSKRKVAIEEEVTFNYSDVKHTKYLIKVK